MKVSEKIVSAAEPQDYEAAKNWDFITTTYGWQEPAIDQYIERHCQFNRHIEQLKDIHDITYSEITDILINHIAYIKKKVESFRD